MKKLEIALLAGGNSSERGIALQSAAQIASALDTAKYNVKIIDLHHRDWIYTAPDGRRFPLDKNDFSLTVDGERTEFEYALIIIHGTPGEDGKLQGYLDMMGIPYSSCSQVSSTITFDKISTKRAVAGGLLAGITGAFIGGNTNKTVHLCKNCGHKWKPGNR